MLERKDLSQPELGSSVIQKSQSAFVMVGGVLHTGIELPVKHLKNVISIDLYIHFQSFQSM